MAENVVSKTNSVLPMEPYDLDPNAGSAIFNETHGGDLLFNQAPAFIPAIRKARRAGFKDAEISKWLSDAETRFHNGGFPQANIDNFFGRSEDTNRTLRQRHEAYSANQLAYYYDKDTEKVSTALSIARNTGFDVQRLIQDDDFTKRVTAYLNANGAQFHQGYVQYIGDRMAEERLNIQKAAANFLALILGDDASEYSYVKDLNAQLEELQRNKPIFETRGQRLMGGTAALALQLLEQYAIGWATGGIGSALGLGAAGIKYANTGGRAFLSVMREAGHGYEEYLKDGQSRGAARASALIAGLLSGGVDYWQNDTIMKMLHDSSAARFLGKGFNKIFGRSTQTLTEELVDAVSEASAGAATREGVRQTLKNPNFWKMLGNSGLVAVKNGFVEVGQEGLQREIILIGREAGRYFSGFDMPKLPEIVRDHMGETWREMDEAFGPMMMVALAGFSVSLPATKADYNRQRNAYTLTNQIRAVEADAAAGILNLNDKVGETVGETIKAATEEYRQGAKMSQEDFDAFLMELGVDPQEYNSKEMGDSVVVVLKKLQDLAKEDKLGAKLLEETRQIESTGTVRDWLNAKNREIYALMDDPMMADTEQASQARSFYDKYYNMFVEDYKKQKADGKIPKISLSVYADGLKLLVNHTLNFMTYLPGLSFEQVMIVRAQAGGLTNVVERFKQGGANKMSLDAKISDLDETQMFALFELAQKYNLDLDNLESSKSVRDIYNDALERLKPRPDLWEQVSVLFDLPSDQSSDQQADQQVSEETLKGMNELMGELDAIGEELAQEDNKKQKRKGEKKQEEEPTAEQTAKPAAISDAISDAIKARVDTAVKGSSPYRVIDALQNKIARMKTIDNKNPAIKEAQASIEYIRERYLNKAQETASPLVFNEKGTLVGVRYWPKSTSYDDIIDWIKSFVTKGFEQLDIAKAKDMLDNVVSGRLHDIGDDLTEDKKRIFERDNEIKKQEGRNRIRREYKVFVKSGNSTEDFIKGVFEVITGAKAKIEFLSEHPIKAARNPSGVEKTVYQTYLNPTVLMVQDLFDRLRSEIPTATDVQAEAQQETNKEEAPAPTPVAADNIIDQVVVPEAKAETEAEANSEAEASDDTEFVSAEEMMYDDNDVPAEADNNTTTLLNAVATVTEADVLDPEQQEQSAKVIPYANVIDRASGKRISNDSLISIFARRANGDPQKTIELLHTEATRFARILRQAIRDGRANDPAVRSRNGDIYTDKETGRPLTVEEHLLNSIVDHINAYCYIAANLVEISPGDPSTVETKEDGKSKVGRPSKQENSGPKPIQKRSIKIKDAKRQKAMLFDGKSKMHNLLSFEEKTAIGALLDMYSDGYVLPDWSLEGDGVSYRLVAAQSLLDIYKRNGNPKYAQAVQMLLNGNIDLVEEGDADVIRLNRSIGNTLGDIDTNVGYRQWLQDTLSQMIAEDIAEDEDEDEAGEQEERDEQVEVKEAQPQASDATQAMIASGEDLKKIYNKLGNEYKLLQRRFAQPLKYETTVEAVKEQMDQVKRDQAYVKRLMSEGVDATQQGAETQAAPATVTDQLIQSGNADIDTSAEAQSTEVQQEVAPAVDETTTQEAAPQEETAADTQPEADVQTEEATQQEEATAEAETQQETEPETQTEATPAPAPAVTEEQATQETKETEAKDAEKKPEEQKQKKKRKKKGEIAPYTSYRVTRAGVSGEMTKDASGVRTVTLFSLEDESTFAHEIGHILYDDLKMLCAIQDPPAWALQGIIEIARLAGGDKATETDRHEFFADALLNYLRFGKSPSKSLRGVFSRSRERLIRLFNQAQIQKIPLSKSVVSLMENMLANDRELDAERAAHTTLRGFMEEVSLASAFKQKRDIEALARVFGDMSMAYNFSEKLTKLWQEAERLEAKTNLENLEADKQVAEGQAKPKKKKDVAEVHDRLFQRFLKGLEEKEIRALNRLVDKRTKQLETAQDTIQTLRDKFREYKQRQSDKQLVSKMFKEINGWFKDNRISAEAKDKLEYLFVGYERNKNGDLIISKRSNKAQEELARLRNFLEVCEGTPDEAKQAGFTDRQIHAVGLSRIGDLSMAEMVDMWFRAKDIADEGRQAVEARRAIEIARSAEIAKEAIDRMGGTVGRLPVYMGADDARGKTYDTAAAKRDVILRAQARAVNEYMEKIYERQANNEEVSKEEISKGTYEARKKAQADVEANWSWFDDVRGWVGKKTQFLTDHMSALVLDRHRRLDMYDGGKATWDGPMYRTFVTAFNIAEAQFRSKVMERGGDMLLSRINEALAPAQRTANDLSQQIVTDDIEINTLFAGHLPTKWHIIGAYINTMLANERNAEAVYGGNFNGALNPEAFAEKLFKFLTPEEKEVGRILFEVSNDEDTFARYNKVYRKYFNKSLTKEEFYYRMFRIESGSHFNMIDINESGLVPSEFGNGLMNDLPGSTITRLDIARGNQRAIELNPLKVLMKNIEEVEHFIAFADPLHRAKLVLQYNKNNQSVLRAIEERWGHAHVDAMKDTYNQLANPGILRGADALDTLLGRVARNTAVAALVGNVAVYLKNFVSLGKWFIDASGSNVAASVTEFLSDRKAFLEKVYSLDPIIAYRQGSPIMDLLKRSPWVHRNVVSRIIDAGLEPNAAIDRWVAAIMFDSVYKTQLSRGASQMDAIEKARETVQRNMQPVSMLELPRLWQRKGALQIPLLFTTETAKLINILGYDLPRKIFNGDAAGAGAVVLATAISAIMLRAMTNGGPDDNEDETWFSWVMSALMDYTVGSIPVIGDHIMRRWDNTFRGERNAFVDYTWDVFDGIYKLATEHDNEIKSNGLNTAENTSLALLNVLAMFGAPIPVQALRRGYLSAADAVSGNLWDAAKMITGMKKQASKKRRR